MNIENKQILLNPTHRWRAEINYWTEEDIRHETNVVQTQRKKPRIFPEQILVNKPRRGKLNLKYYN